MLFKMMIKQLLFTLIFFLSLNMVLGGGCCLNPGDYACEYVTDIAICCETEECENQMFVEGNSEACATLTGIYATACETGCCCERNAGGITSNLLSQTACQGETKRWTASRDNCDSFCRGAFTSISPQSESAPDWWQPGDGPVCWEDSNGEFHCYEPFEQTTTTVNVEEIIEEEHLNFENPIMNVPDGSECSTYGGVCRYSLFSPLGANPCNSREELIEESDCGIFRKCCQIGMIDIKSEYNSDSTYELVYLNRYSELGSKGLSFFIPERGTLWAGLKADKKYFTNKQFSSISINGKEFEKIKSGSKVIELAVNAGDHIFAEARGKTCLFFLCRSTASIDLGFSIFYGPNIGTDIETNNLGSGFVDVLAGVGSNNEIRECTMNWGDGNTEAFDPIRFNKVNHHYLVPKDYRIEYQCTDNSGASTSDQNLIKNDVECFNTGDCFDKEPESECEGGFYSCRDGLCVWNCPFEATETVNKEASENARNTRQTALNQCRELCNSPDPETQAQFFAMNQNLEKYMDELNIKNTDCSSIVDSLAMCPASFIAEVNKIAEVIG